MIRVALNTPRTRLRVTAGILGGILLIVDGLLVVGGAYALRRRALVFAPAGLAYESRARPWHVPWPELSRASVEHGWRPTRGSRLAKQRRVRLVLVPADPAAFAASHPQLARFRGRFGAATQGYAFPLGPAIELVAPLAEGLRTYAGTADGGVRDLGRLPGNGLL